MSDIPRDRVYTLVLRNRAAQEEQSGENIRRNHASRNQPSGSDTPDPTQVMRRNIVVGRAVEEARRRAAVRYRAVRERSAREAAEMANFYNENEIRDMMTALNLREFNEDMIRELSEYFEE